MMPGKGGDPALFAVVLAGGSGTRFWPLSRELMPKQFLSLVGPDSLLKQTIQRIEVLVPPRRILVVTGPAQAEEVYRQLGSVRKDSVPEEYSVIVEPKGRNTAPAIGLAAVVIRKADPEGVMAVLPSDHYIRDSEQFIKDLHGAVAAAREGLLVTLGIPPTRPETGFGYIEFDSRDSGKTYLPVRSFTEKPDLATAQQYVEQGNFSWNSGMFVWKADVILGEIERYLPDLHAGLVEVERIIGEVGGRNYSQAMDTLETEEVKQAVARVYERIEPVSIDYGVMEKSEKVVTVPARFDWSDVGSFGALFDLLPRDGQGNVISGRVVDIESENSLIRGEKRLLATLGLKDVIVVDTEDAVLVCARDRAQEVRRIVERLREEGQEESLIHRTVMRPWGSYTVLDRGDKFKIKRVEVNPKSRLSLQLHHHRSEHWVVVSGTARVTVAEKVFDVHPGESTFVPASTRHRLENPGIIPLVLIEVQNGEYLEEDDIVRLEDDYRRV